MIARAFVCARASSTASAFVVAAPIMTTDKMASRLDACSSVRERVARVFTDDRVVFVVVFEELVDARSSARGTVVVVDIMALGRASKSGETLRDVVSSRYKSYRYKSLVHAFRVVLMRRRGNHALSSVRPDVPSVSSFSNAAAKSAKNSSCDFAYASTYLLNFGSSINAMSLGSIMSCPEGSLY